MPGKDRSTRLLTAVVTVLLLGMMVTSIVSMQRIKSLSLPISRATSIATLILPIATGLSLQGGASLSRHRSANKSSLSWPTLAIFVALTIYETVIITLSLTHMVPPSDLTCHLDRQWRQMYSHKNADGIKRIQDTHNCCGLHSVKDMAWPFPAKDRPVTACVDTFGRGKSCFGSWRRDEQISAGLFLLVALTTFVVKITVLLFWRPSTPWIRHRQFSASGNHADEPTPKHRNQARIEGQYHDHEAPEVGTGSGRSGDGRAITMGNGQAGEDDHARVLLPSSQLQEQQGRNEWV